jgi:hypothetical protein
MSVKRELHIIVPGICGPLAEVDTLKDNRLIQQWVKTLSRSQHYPSSKNLHDVVTELFDLRIKEDFPSAALSLLANDTYDPAMSYMHADPVHLQADMDHAVLTSSIDLAISEQEAQHLCDTLNQHFNQDGLSFFRACKDQWFVSTVNKIRMKTTSLTNATGRNVNFILPQGEDARYWKRVLTEAQMLMHSHDDNITRENTGRQSINSLWFHGSGDLPEYGHAEITRVCSDHDMFKGLARHLNLQYLAVPESVDAYIEYLYKNNQPVVNVLHLSVLEHMINYTDVSLWLEGLHPTLQQWLYPLISAAHNARIEVVLYTCNGKKYHLSKYDGLKFWQKGTLDQYIRCHKTDVH